MPLFATAIVGPCDRSCRWWAKFFRASARIPLPKAAMCAADLPGSYLRAGEKKLRPGDVLFEDEQIHRRKNYGWTYTATICGPDGRVVRLRYDRKVRSRLVQQRLNAKLRAGSGGLAGVVPVVHALKAGVDPYDDDPSRGVGGGYG